ncbi:response regulator [Brachyspira catarrhinii]|uniref:Response regulator n=1 Tax=Brachyspira catarrhinii TaxID=2528966 RepID=A0ABY2TTJ8_9SPIR|nr:response regulator [Brachyspira catarrhinii]TKZ36216.1 response regulator [Brachyspira catarrhinii]
MDSPIIIIDDDNRATKIKALLESSDFQVFTAENLYELMGQIYKYNIKILIFNPDLVWVNAIEFITEFRKLKSLKDAEYKIFFLCENTEKEIKEKARELNITCLEYPKNMNKLINHIKTFDKKVPI